MTLDEFLDDLFLGCAFAAWIDQAVEDQCWPDEEKTRLRAYRYYEDELAEREREHSRTCPAHRNSHSFLRRIQ
jgi:hypothetical protein